MRDKRRWIFLGLLMFFLFVGIYALRKMNIYPDKPRLSSLEKEWIKSQKGKKIPFLIPENDSPYFYQIPGDQFGGVYYDYLQTLQKEYGLEFQITKKNTVQSTQDINEGKETVVFNATFNSEREKIYNFLNLNSQTSIVLVQKFGKEFPQDNKYLKKLGIIKNTTEARDYFDHFSSSQYQIISLDNLQEGVSKIKNGEIDLLLGKSKDFMIQDIKISVVEKLQNFNNSLAINRNYPQLYSILEKTSKYFDYKDFNGSFAKHKNLFAAQKLKDSPILREVKNRYSKIVMEIPDEDNLLPLYYFSEGKFQGYIPTMLKNMSTVIGIPIDIRKSSSPEKKHIRAVDFSDSNDLNIPYYKLEMVVAGKTGSRYIKSFNDLKDKSVGIVLNDFTKTLFLKKHTNFVTFFNTGEALLALKNGTVDYVIGDFVFLDSRIENLHLGNDLKILGILGDFPYQLAFTFREGDKILYTLFSQIFPKDISEFSNLREHLISPKIIDSNYYYFGTFLLILCGILGIVLIFLKINMKYRKKAENLNRAMISSLEMAASFSDADTGQHIVRVTKYSELLAKEIDLSSQMVRDIGRYASLHDIGKIGIPNSILKKSGKLDPEEIVEMRKHSDIGYQLVKNAGLGKTAENLVRFHHERWDGNGYPLGLREKSIPVEARVVALADVYDALRQKRSYKSAYTHHEAVQIMVSKSGIFFDPDLVDIFLKLSREFDEIFSKH